MSADQVATLEESVEELAGAILGPRRSALQGGGRRSELGIMHRMAEMERGLKTPGRGSCQRRAESPPVTCCCGDTRCATHHGCPVHPRRPSRCLIQKCWSPSVTSETEDDQLPHHHSRSMRYLPVVSSRYSVVSWPSYARCASLRSALDAFVSNFLLIP